MADEHDQQKETLDLTEEVQDGQPDPQHDGGDDTYEVELEGEQVSGHDEPDHIRDLRARFRDQARELDAYRKQAKPAAAVEVGQRPSIESCDYDQERFDREYDAWAERKAKADGADRDRQEQERVANEALNRSVSNYRAKAAALPVKNYQDAENAVTSRLSPTTVNAAVSYIDDLPKIVLALHKYPDQLERIAAEPDAVRQLMMMKDMERKLNVTTRRKPPPPEAETIQRGTAPVAKISGDKKLAALEKRALETGDRTELSVYRRQQEAQTKKR